MKNYIVGGFVRDTLLGFNPQDRDIVVVGSCPKEMIDAGFKMVGADFPVFLHPETKEEYALARIDRKVGIGTNGFTSETNGVTLEEDLSRRDLTINSMAMSDDGVIHDPYKGQEDIKNKVFRHVTSAFSEDPLRVLRVARFAARYGSAWSIAPETLKLMKSMVSSGEVDTIKGERIWAEIAKGLGETNPEIMLQVLNSVGFFDRDCFQEYASGKNYEEEALRIAVQKNSNISVRFALAFPGAGVTQFSKMSRLPSEVRDTARSTCIAEEMNIYDFASLDSKKKLNLIISIDGLRKADRLLNVLTVIDCKKVDASHNISKCIDGLLKIDSRSVIRGEKNSDVVRKLIEHARLNVLEDIEFNNAEVKKIKSNSMLHK